MNTGLIGLVGAAGAGKDTIADHLIERYGFERLSFARKLKEIISEVFDVPLHYFDDRDLKNAPHEKLHHSTIEKKFLSSEYFAEYLIPVLSELYGKNEAEVVALGWHEIAANFFYCLIPCSNCSPRRAAQLIGTEGFRDKISHSTWTDYVVRQAVSLAAEGKLAVISDLRFPNEMSAIRGIGGAPVGVSRLQIESHAHSSEQHITEMLKECDVLIENNGTIAELLCTVDGFVAENQNDQPGVLVSSRL